PGIEHNAFSVTRSAFSIPRLAFLIVNMKRHFIISLVLSLLLGSYMAARADTITITPQQPLQLAQYGQMEYLLDPKGTLQIADVLTSSKFQKTGKQIPNFAITPNTVWLRFTVANQTPEN